MSPITIYTDGSALGNPGPGGYGAVLLSGHHRKELSQGFRLTTNNRMELMAVCVALEDLGLKTLVVSRTPREGMISYSDITPAIMDEYKVIVNTTPLGMYPHTDRCPDIPYDLINSDFLCYDLLYNPDVTLFMKKSAEHGAETKNGLEMLLLQAFESWEIWTGRR